MLNSGSVTTKRLKKNSLHSLKSTKNISGSNSSRTQKNPRKYRNFRICRDAIDPKRCKVNTKENTYKSTDIIKSQKILDIKAKNTIEMALNPSNRIMKAIIKKNKNRNKAIYSALHKI